MSALPRRWLAVLAWAAAGCGQPPSGHGLLIVDLTSSTPFVAASLHVTASSGGSTGSVDVLDGAPFDFSSPHSFALDIPPADLGNVTVTVDARDGTGKVVAGPATQTKHVDKDTQTHVTLVLGIPTCAALTNPILCDDFEEGKVNDSVWITDVAHGSVNIDKSRTHSGLYALHQQIEVDPGDGERVAADIYTKPQVLADAANGYWYRAWFYAQPGSMTPFPPTQLIGIDQASMPANGLRLVWNGKDLAFVGTGVFHNNDITQAPMPLNTWFCLEWHLFPYGMSGIDGMDAHLGAELIESVGSGIGMARYDTIGFGLGHGSMPGFPAGELWIDDIVFDTKEIGCP
jgi:hypothetical protein